MRPAHEIRELLSRFGSDSTSALDIELLFDIRELLAERLAPQPQAAVAPQGFSHPGTDATTPGAEPGCGVLTPEEIARWLLPCDCLTKRGDLDRQARCTGHRREAVAAAIQRERDRLLAKNARLLDLNADLRCQVDTAARQHELLVEKLNSPRGAAFADSTRPEPTEHEIAHALRRAWASRSFDGLGSDELPRWLAVASLAKEMLR